MPGRKLLTSPPPHHVLAPVKRPPSPKACQGYVGVYVCVCVCVSCSLCTADTERAGWDWPDSLTALQQEKVFRKQIKQKRQDLKRHHHTYSLPCLGRIHLAIFVFLAASVLGGGVCPDSVLVFTL